MTKGILKNNNISLKLLILILLSVLLPRYAAWIINIMAILIDFIRNRRALLKVSPAFVPVLILLIVGILSGIACGFNSGIWPFLRDIILVTFYFIYWQVSSDAYSYCPESIVTTVYTACWLIDIINTPQRLVNFFNGASSFESFVSTGSVSYVINGIGLFLVFFKPYKAKHYYDSSVVEGITNIIVITTFLISFSRSSIIVFLVLLLFNSYKRIKPIIAIIALTIISIIALRIVLPDVYTYFGEKIFNSLNELTGKNITSWTDYNIVNDWRAYEVYCAKKQFASFNLIQKLFGHGFGTLINAEGYEYLVTSENGLAILHNGYFTTLVKTGYIGILCYILGYFSMLFYISINVHGYYKRLAFGLICSEIVTTAFVNGTLFGGANFVFILLLSYSLSEGRKDF